MGSLRRDLRLHESKHIPLAWTLQGSDPHSVAADHDPVSLTNVRHGDGSRCGPLCTHQNSEIHLNPIDIDPLLMKPDLRGQMGCCIEVIGEDSVGGGLGGSTVCIPFDRSPMRLDRLENVVQECCRR